MKTSNTFRIESEVRKDESRRVRSKSCPPAINLNSPLTNVQQSRSRSRSVPCSGISKSSRNLNPREVLAIIEDDIELEEGYEMSKHINEDEVHSDGLWNVRAIVFLILWYIFSACTLFLNKYILSTMKGDPTLLGTFQMLVTTLCGFVQMYVPCGMYRPIQRLTKPPGFWKHMLVVGCTRFITVILGLVALNYVAVSFTETIKSSAPLFTVVLSLIILRERTSLYVVLSLVPIVGGLFLCSLTELSFSLLGFIAAMATNITECPAELQFYTSLASVVLQIPLSMILVDMMILLKMDFMMVGAFLLNGILFHFQSITAYVLMDYISPVTHSVANTVKRALLIILSVIIFGNSITILSGLGTAVVFIGVLCYSKATSLQRRTVHRAS